MEEEGERNTKGL
ncbi:hypothetical protein FQN60_000337 [Etheostoma spectabile]|uniref:Uncharacterized protein n=1 Tax=Etheostoma spectabile TaxID=54343 RepID=A0A5J5D4R4_9PERO|nr:hypothetical protein FQN60_000337 [Etheostoma spectabile]